MIDGFMGSRQHFASHHLDNVLFQDAYDLAAEMQKMNMIQVAL